MEWKTIMQEIGLKAADFLLNIPKRGVARRARLYLISMYGSIILLWGTVFFKVLVMR